METSAWELLSNTARSMDSPASMLKASSRQWKIKQDKWSERFGRYRGFLQIQGNSPASGALALLATGLHVAPPQPVIEDSTIEAYLSLLAKWARGRRFFTTKKGHIGLGVQDSAVGDRVVILSMDQQPSRTPFLLRAEPGSAIVRLVGEAYIHNFNYPEADKMHWIAMNIS
ncbi:hypothetical protein FB567DRAFT_170785 [Paraphoma chrysanthemicola]|uniref:Uncharacterized protein n=1 Tax=Paraphoma chrysanthemicola TaxID=798071 RepID=A0A8K0RH86_9PLEO|nr:hypothetical protein FB567DRAFT_170785 [Paraphoma chrysanthemicola]